MLSIHARFRLQRLRLGAGLLLALSMLCMAPAAWGQDGERLRAELERTDQILQRAEETVRRSGEPRAVEALQLAQRAQEAAWSHFRAVRPVLAFQETLRARDLARRALALATQGGEFEQRAQRLLDEAARNLERTRDCAGDRPSEPVRRLLNLAGARLEQAREAFHEQRFRIAADIAAQVNRMLDGVCGGPAVGHVEMLLDDVGRLLERATQDVRAAGNRDAMLLIERAHDLMQRAEQLRDAGNFDPAVQQAEQARDLVLRAMRQTERPPDVADVDRILQDATTYVGDLAGQVRGLGNPEAVTLMERAQEHLDRARALRAGQRLRQALAETRVARNLARRAAQLAGIKQL